MQSAELLQLAVEFEVVFFTTGSPETSAPSLHPRGVSELSATATVGRIAAAHAVSINSSGPAVERLGNTLVMATVIGLRNSYLTPYSSWRYS